jgi:hypothetical protein
MMTLISRGHILRFINSRDQRKKIMNNDMDKSKSQPKSGNREREDAVKERVKDATDPNVKNPVTSANKTDAPGTKSPSAGTPGTSNQTGGARQGGSNQDGNKAGSPGGTGGTARGNSGVTGSQNQNQSKKSEQRDTGGAAGKRADDRDSTGFGTGALGRNDADGGSPPNQGSKARQGDEKPGSQRKQNPGKTNAADGADDEDGVGA